MSKMTAAERKDLMQVVKTNAKVAKADAEARGRWMIADAEAKLAARYKAEDEDWADIVEAANQAVAEADAAIAALCRERSIPEDFRPSLHLGFYGRGENAFKERREELRRVAETKVDALVGQAKLEIDRQAAQQLTQITKSGLTSEEARAFIETMPTPEQLLPPLGALQLENGQLVKLETTVTVTPSHNSEVTAVTARRNKCGHCGQAFTPSRKDGKFCSDKCRVADFRKRHQTAEEETR
jgi:hypothetical protein